MKFSFTAYLLLFINNPRNLTLVGLVMTHILYEYTQLSYEYAYLSYKYTIWVMNVV